MLDDEVTSLGCNHKSEQLRGPEDEIIGGPERSPFSWRGKPPRTGVLVLGFF